MKISLALGKGEGLSRQTARGCVGTNLALPGFGSLMAGRVVGYAQAALTIPGFVMTMVFGVKFMVWFLANSAEIYGADADPVEVWTELWQQLRWALLGMGLFAVAWLWAQTTNAAILRQASKTEERAKPPKLV